MNYLERLLEEREQLQDRIDKLRIFLDKETKEATVTTEADRRLLALQRPFMEEYKKVLDNRIYIAENKKRSEEAMEDFELDTFLSQNLRIKKYNKNERNDFLVYNTKFETWNIDWEFETQSQFIYFEKIDWSVVETLTKKGITMRELREAYRYLGWL